MFCKIRLILVIISSVAYELVQSTEILITLPNGTIQGKELITKLNTRYYGFYKVPYAAPPIGELRFKAPVPPQNWSGVLDCTRNSVICYQVNRELPIESEDCLYLNIYTPQLPEKRRGLLPVIFYIHGGGFIQGACLESICGPNFFIDYNIVVVTITYRLGPFGFLSTQDDVILGNNGLKDQHLGIKWVHENVHLFGGDPEKITIVGHSAGAASVTYQLLNEKSTGLFRGAISQSGSFLSPWSFQRNAREIAFKTAGYINESFLASDDSTELLNFLRTVTADELDDASWKTFLEENLKNRQLNQGYFYAPVIEVEHGQAFITRKMYGDLKNGNFVKVPILMGITSEEALTDANDLNVLRENMVLYDENLDWLVPNDMNILHEERKKLVGAVIRSIYTNSKFEKDLSAGIRYFSDTAFTRPVIQHAELQSKFTNVYFYQFSYDGIIGNVSTTIEGAGNVAHTEDVSYMWQVIFGGYDNSDINVFPEADILTHKRLLTLWSNFVKTLNPTPEKTEIFNNVIWPLFATKKSRDFWYLNINTNLTLHRYPKIGSYLGWTLVYHLFGKGDYDTY